MFDKCVATVTYSSSFSLSTLEQNLDPNFLAVLLKTLHLESLNDAYVHVDFVNNGLTFEHMEEYK